MNALADQIARDLVSAMKAGDKLKVETLRGLQSDLKYRRIAEGRDLTEQDTVSALRQAAKKRREAMEAFTGGGRQDLAQKEEQELAMILSYLPPELSDTQLDEMIRSALEESGANSPSQMGQVMKLVMPKVAGQASGDRVRARVQSLLTSGT